MSRSDHLTVWLGDVAVATVRRSSGDRILLRYSDAALDTWTINQPVLSCALLLGTGTLDAVPFIDGLLPEGDTRRSLADLARIPAHDLFGLIRRYGRDVAGAVQFLEEGDIPSTDRYGLQELGDAEVGELVDGLDGNPLAIIDESELSLAGLQAKMLTVALGDGRWARPLGGRPSTHILKRDHLKHRGLVNAECEALTLARDAGLTSFDAHIEQIAGYDCLVVERFDRVVAADGNVTRIHQEDACQALGRPARQKYELHHGGGGPEFCEIAGILDRHSIDVASELDRLAKYATFTAIIGNADAHGKNLAFLLVDGHVALAPMFDTVPTVLWPTLRTEAAMTIGGVLTFDGVDREAIEREAKSWRHDPDAAGAAATACAERALDGIEREIIDPEGPLATHVRRTAPRFCADPSV